MKPIAVLYATRENTSLGIAEHVAKQLAAHGFASTLRDVRTAGEAFPLRGFGGAVLVASIHMGRHEAEMIRFATVHRAELARMPSAFVSVSLTEAAAEDHTHSARDRENAAANVRAMLEAFFGATGWHPELVKPVAGVVAYTRYGWLKRMFVRFMAKRGGLPTDTSRDHAYTDWRALDVFVERFAAAARSVCTETQELHAPRVA
jgi:menaquinone-dependent protoporphyrinogen oxidase